MNERTKIGRLAMRQEGQLWNAYYADSDNMKGAILIGSILLSAVLSSEDRKRRFMDLMREVVADIIEEMTGIRPTWGGPEVAPEHERAGHG